MSTQRIKLEICGSSYVVSTNDPEQYLLGLAERLDRDMNQLMVESPNASVTAAAVITALAYLDDAEKSAQGADNMRAQIQGYLEDASKARLAVEEMRRENDRLRNELDYYRRQAEGGRPRKKSDTLLDYGQAESADAEQMDGQLELDVE